MKSEFFNDFYKSLEKQTSHEYTESLRELINSKNLTENQLEKIIMEKDK